MTTVDIVLSVGSNRSSEDVVKAIDWIRTVLSRCEVSSIYQTPPIQGYGKPYKNAVVKGASNLEEDTLNTIIKEYELRNGRDAKARIEGNVPIDIDIVIRNGEVIRPRDFNQSFFQIGFSELPCTVIKCETDA